MPVHQLYMDRDEFLHMKNELNRNIIGITNLREEDLFREMANQFNNNVTAN